jgi:tetratricopeptide (TPR) repeat protein
MQKNKIPGALLGLCLLLGLGSGCSPSGPRVLMEGRDQLARGNTPAAIECFQKAVRMMPTNALAYAHLGLALQKAGQTTNAIACCQQALLRDRDLTEVHYNLGCLWLETGDADSAKSEFTAFTIHQPKVIDGWLKLGAAHLGSRDPRGPENAETSFAEALRLDFHCGEAWNGLGLVRLKRHRYSEAADYFASAVRQQPGYAPAIRNLAIVYHQYLRNKPAALKTYREYLALTPRPADADAVLRVARSLERELAPPPSQPVVTNTPTAAVQPVAPVQRPPSLVATNPPTMAHPPATSVAATTTTPVKPAPAPAPVASRPVPAPRPVQIPTGALEVVQVTAPPELRTTPDTNPPVPPAPAPRPAVETPAPAPTAAPAEKTAVVQTSPVPQKKGFFSRLNPMNLFKSEDKKEAASMKKPTPLPPSKKSTAGTSQSATPAAPVTATPATQDVRVAVAPAPRPAPAPAPAPVPVPRYAYSQPSKPAPGNRAEAARWFDKGLQHHSAQQLDLAVTEYGQALTNDPACFEAAYNMTLALRSLGRAAPALKASEAALSIRPESVDAQFNFALALRDNGYWLDAAAEFEKMLVADDREARVHLALGKLFDEKLRRPADARLHYLKVLELEPRNPNALAIREWLAAHPVR